MFSSEYLPSPFEKDPNELPLSVIAAPGNVSPSSDFMCPDRLADGFCARVINDKAQNSPICRILLICIALKCFSVYKHCAFAQWAGWLQPPGFIYFILDRSLVVVRSYSKIYVKL